MPLLQTLEIHEVITPQAVDQQRAALKRQVRNIANGARNFAVGLRRRMNALDSPEGGSAPQVVDPKEFPAAPSAEPSAELFAEPETRLTAAASDVPTNSMPIHADVPAAAGE
jgi:hypothetical protein